MNFQNAMVGLKKGRDARRANWDQLSYIRLEDGKLHSFRGDFGWDEWTPSKEDLEAADWLVGYPA